MAVTTEVTDARVEGGSTDGLIVQVKVKDDGSAEVVNGAVFGIDLTCWYDRERSVVVVPSVSSSEGS